MATSWPIVLDTIYGGAVYFGERVAALTGGRFKITAAPGGELVPALEILQSVQTGAVASGHTASYYYTGIDPITQLSTCVPFGMSARGHISWMTEGGGLELIQAAFRERFGVVNFPAGNTGCQMGGWFNKEITGVGDLGGLRMRIPGMGGQALEKLGVSVQVIPGGEIYQSLESGAIDGAEWVGPYDDLQQEFNKVTEFYYYPGWWEPGPSLDVLFPADEYDKLPEEYQAVLQSAAAESYTQMLAKYDTLNPPALADDQGRAASPSCRSPTTCSRRRTAPCRRSSTRTPLPTPGTRRSSTAIGPTRPSSTRGTASPRRRCSTSSPSRDRSICSRGAPPSGGAPLPS